MTPTYQSLVSIFMECLTWENKMTKWWCICEQKIEWETNFVNITQNLTLTRTVLSTCTCKKSSYFKYLILIIAESKCIYWGCGWLIPPSTIFQLYHGRVVLSASTNWLWYWKLLVSVTSNNDVTDNKNKYHFLMSQHTLSLE